ncbi:MAG: hypothetical protein PHP76_05930 [Bacteroidales bacterium]|nr:hypothetical protein [Bacteroidales bacterium]
MRKALIFVLMVAAFGFVGRSFHNVNFLSLDLLLREQTNISATDSEAYLPSLSRVFAVNGNTTGRVSTSRIQKNLTRVPGAPSIGASRKQHIFSPEILLLIERCISTVSDISIKGSIFRI